MNQFPFQFNGQHFWLSSERAIFWEDEKALILSDCHFGKTGHFRKSGIALPQDIFLEDLQRFFNLLQFYKPGYVIIVGDLFHSKSNKEHLLFAKWRNDFLQMPVLLVKGNHDILQEDWYKQINIKVYAGELLKINEFAFIHDAGDIENLPQEKGNYFFTGHLHPGISIKGKGRQSFTCPCFYFNQKFAVLPAFSKFSGLALVKKKKTDHVFAIANNELIKV